ncbi:MgtC/SapB family protein [Scytonema sp. NUACC21]
MNEMFFSPSDWQSISFRLVVALLVGGAIGMNRQRTGRPAGLRTFMVVSLSAALFVMIPLQVASDGSLTDNVLARSTALNAMARIAQGIATGVGFLGAGIILRQQRQDFGTEEIKGLTTAASIWLAGGLGAASGCGLWQMSLIGTLLALMVLSVVKKLKKSNLIRQSPKSEETAKSETTIDDIKY